MNWFKFDWFRSDDRKELDRLKLEEQELKNALLEVKLADVFDQQDRPYKKLVYSGNHLTVIMKGGVVINKKGITPDVFQQVKVAESESEIRDLLAPKEVVFETPKVSAEEAGLVKNNLDILRNNPDFTFDKESVFLNGVKLPIPPEVLASFIELGEKSLLGDNTVQDKYQSLKMFWLKLATSPRKESREQVLTFCRDNDIRISKRGNIIAYRRVKTWKSPVDTKLKAFVDAEYAKLKSWKKSPANFDVWSEDDGSFITTKLGMKADGISTNMGNLADLKISLEDTTGEQLYTSAHNAGKYTFKIGDVYKADEDDIDTNAGNCNSGGLHFAAVNYDYSGFGSVPVVVLVNPAKTITIPTYEIKKGRTVEMKIACINPNAHGVHIDEALIDKADEEYNEFTMDQLENALKTKDFSELCVQEEVPTISLVDLAAITKALKERIVKI